MAKRDKRRKADTEPEADDKLPFGYLESADPPRKNIVLLAIAAVAFVLWMVALVCLAFWSQ